MIPEQMKPALRDTLLKGGYNLLLGSGVTLDSHNSLGEPLRSSEQLRRDLCTVTGAPATTSLTRAYALLQPDLRRNELTQRFAGCQPGPSVESLPRFLWRRLFTFNIDDVLENLYEGGTERKQVLVPLNFDAAFEPTPERNELHAVHLHGWVRQAEAGYVFSASEYVRVMSTLNPWMHLLSEILATESFIIAGTSLNEIDLEYYLSHRTQKTPRRGRGPSLLVEPNPDVVTRADCDRYGLILVPATYGEFMKWLCAEFPSPPSLADLVVPDISTLFSERPEPHKLLRFFSDFELVAATELPLSGIPSAFLYGREPQWSDLHEHVDIERRDNGVLGDLLTARPTGAPDEPQPVVVVLDEAGTGKTTAIKRVAHELARSGTPVLTVHTASRIDTRVAAECLSRIRKRLILVVDGLADHAEQVVELLEDRVIASKVVLLAAERSYRREYLDVVFGQRGRSTRKLLPLTLDELQQLLERFRGYGLVGAPEAIGRPREFAARLSGDPISVAVCRILNDFRPLDRIVQSLWNAAAAADRILYLCVALAQHCYRVGLRYSLLQAIAGPGLPIARLLDSDIALKLAPSAVDDDYVVALNAIIADRILHRASRHEPKILMSAFVQLASALAPHVNRRAIMRRSPEARLVGRLLDADKVVQPLLGTAAEGFYVSVQTQWEWNSRYWEQRALLSAENDLDVALQYARHAVAIERHPFTLTTLGKILLRQMEVAPGGKEGLYGEAFESLSAAIESEARRLRITVHPFATLLSGTARYCEFGGVLTAHQRERIDGYAGDAETRFGRDVLIGAALRRLDAALEPNS